MTFSYKYTKVFTFTFLINQDIPYSKCVGLQTLYIFIRNKQLDIISAKSKQSNDTIKLMYLMPNKVITFKIPKSLSYLH